MKKGMKESLKKKLIIGIVISIVFSMLYMFQYNEKKKSEERLAWSEEYYGKSVLEYRNKKYSEALKSIDEAILYHKSEKNLILRASINEKLLDSEAMVSDYTTLIELDKENKSYYNGRGNVYIILEDYQKAIDDFEKSLKIDEKQKDVISLLQNSYLKTEEYDKAYLWAKKLYEIDKNEGNYLMYLQASYFNEKYDEILGTAIKSFDEKPSDALATLVANCYYQKEQFKKALTYYIEIKEKSNEVYLLMGYASYLSENYKDAKKYLQLSKSKEESVLAMIKGCDLILKEQGKDLSTSGLIDKDGNLIDEYYKYLAYEYYNQEKYKETIKYLLIYIEKSKDVSQYFVLANCYNLIEKVDEAIQYYTLSIENNIELGNSHYNRGVLYLNKQMYKEAVGDFGESYELKIKQDYSKYNQGISYMNMSKFKESTQCFLKVVEISKDKELIEKAKDILSRYYVS